MCLRKTFLSFLACIATASFVNAQALPPGGNANALAAIVPGGEEMIPRVLMPDADIDTFVGALQIYTGKTILRPSALPVGNGTFNLMITTPMSKADVVRAIETVLELNSIAVVQMDDKFLKIVALATARTEAPRIINGSALDLSPSGSIATKIFTLDFLPLAATAASIQTSMLTQGIAGGIVQLASANAFMVTDTISNLQRIELFLQGVDRPASSNLKPKFYTLKNGRASTMIATLRSTVTAALQTQLGPTTTFAADDRTNQIVLVADPRVYPFFDGLISSLDIKADPSTRQEVIYLKSADATTLATMISTLINGQNQAAQRTNAANLRPGQGAQIITPNNLPVGPAGGAPGVAAPAVPVAAPTAASGAALGAAALAAGAGAGASEFSTLVTVQPSTRENAIIVNGTADDVRMIKELVEKLDTALPQVAIDVIIAEVTLSDKDTSGISALNLTIGTDTSLGTAVPGATAGTTSIVGAAVDGTRGTHITSISDLQIGGWGITNAVINPLAMTAALANQGSRNNVKIVQANTITTTHNKLGTFQVTERRPYVAGTTANATTGTTSQTAFADIGISVNVTPLIGADGTIQMHIDQVVDDVVGSVTIDTNPVPSIGHRQATSDVTVKNGEMIVLGGLQSRKASNDRQKIGFIWEIPIVSNLLGGRTKQTDRTELLFFIRPRIIRPGEGTADAQKHIDDLSNKDQVDSLMNNPAKLTKDNILEFFK